MFVNLHHFQQQLQPLQAVVIHGICYNSELCVRHGSMAMLVLTLVSTLVGEEPDFKRLYFPFSFPPLVGAFEFGFCNWSLCSTFSPRLRFMLTHCSRGEICWLSKMAIMASPDASSSTTSSPAAYFIYMLSLFEVVDMGFEFPFWNEPIKTVLGGVGAFWSCGRCSFQQLSSTSFFSSSSSSSSMASQMKLGCVDLRQPQVLATIQSC